MTKPADRRLRRLDDGRIVYRLHPRAKAMLLSEAEYDFVEHLVLRKTLFGALSCVAVFGSTLLCLHLWSKWAVSPVPLIAFLALLICLVIVVDQRLIARLNTILDAAPLSMEDRLEARSSRLQVFQSALKNSLRRAPPLVIWSLVLKLIVILLWSLFVLMKQTAGKDSAASDIHPIILVATAVIAGLCLRAVLRERRR